MKKIFFITAMLFFAVAAFAADFTITIELTDVITGKGKLYVSISDSAAGYKASKPLKSMVLDSSSATITLTEKLSEGEYVISAYQDTNGNGKLDASFIGIPKEPVGISNYNGKGAPGGFDTLKTRIDKEQKIIVAMKKI
jgi:uncharacterized protein (DUF2141 family)